MKEFRPTEADEQRTVFEWAQMARHRWPELALMYAIPNGAMLGGHNRFAVIAALKAQGLKPSVPDLCLPAPRLGYAALYI